LDELNNNKFLTAVTPVILYLFLVFNGVLGVKFGMHWDDWVFINSAVETLETGVFLPHIYLYPSFCYYIVTIAAGIYKAFYGIADPKTLFTDQNFYHYIRCIFVFISSLTVIWVYLLSKKITKNYFASLIAGLVVCSSFEFGYHSRWSVSDCILVQFAALSTLFLFLNISKRNKIIFSSLIAGIAAGTKYPGGIVFLNILVFILSDLKFNREGLKNAAGYIFLLSGFFFIGFIITTPGAIFEFKQFIFDINYSKNAYSGGQYGHTVQAGFDHFSKIVEYVIYVLFSKTPVISFLIFLFAIAGVAVILMEKKWDLSGLFITMLIYIIYLSSFNVMIVRNLLILLPFFAVFVSIGFLYISNKIQKYKFSIALKPVILILFFYSCSKIVVASFSTINNPEINLSREVEKYKEQNKDKELILSLEAASQLKVPFNSNINPTDKSYLVFYKNEIPMQLYTANIRNQFSDIIGIDDVNFDYYPTWSGKNRLVVMRYQNASEDILFYALKGKKSISVHKIICDAENLSSDNSGFLSKEFLNDTLINDKSTQILFEGVRTRSNELVRSGRYSFKLDKSNPFGPVFKIQVKKGNRYQFLVWRNNPDHNGCLVVDNPQNKFAYGSFDDCITSVSEMDKNGWELLQYDFYATDSSPAELSVYTRLSDSLSPAYFDDFTIVSYERPGK